MENYRIAIGISLTGNVRGMLGLIARDFARTDAEAVKLQRTLKGIQLMTLAGGAMAGAGFLGLKALGDTLRPAREYAHQLNIMNMAGMKHVEIAQAIGDAWRTTGQVVTTTATENLRSLLDLRNILVSQDRERYAGRPPAPGTAAYQRMMTSDWQAARAALPLIAQMQAGMEAADPRLFRRGAQGQEFAFSAAKALDIRGAAQDPKRFAEELERMGQVGIWSQNRVTPRMFQNVMFYMRQAGMSLDPNFVYGVLPSLMLEQASSGSQGGGSRGIGPAVAAAYRSVVQGYGINRKTLPMLRQLGLVGPHAALRTTTQGTTVGAMTGADLFAKDQFAWTQQVFRPRLEAYMRQHHIANTTENELMLIGQMTRGNQLFGWILGQYLGKAGNIQRDQELISEAMRPSAAYQYALKHDPELALRAANAQWTNLKTVIGNDILPVVIPAIKELAQGLHELSDWARKNRGEVKALVYGFAALSSALAISGTILTVAAAFRALKLVLWTMPAVAARAGANAVAAGGGTLVTGAAGIFGGLSALGAAALFAPDSMLPKGAPQARKSAFDNLRRWINREFTGAAPGHEHLPSMHGGNWDFAHAAGSIAGRSAAAMVSQAVIQSGDKTTKATATGSNEIVAAIGRLQAAITGLASAVAREASKPPTDAGGVDSRLAPLYPATAY